MNYFNFHIGDYAAATSHLSLIEDAIYMRLLRRYYLTEAPLPADIKATARLVSARSPDEIAAVETVLSEFFILDDSGWHNHRADEEIDAYHRMAEGGKKGAAKRWNNKQDEVAIPPLSPAYAPPNGPPNANQEPRTKNQEPNKTLTQETVVSCLARAPDPEPVAPSKPSPKRRRQSALPDDFYPNDTGQALARELGVCQSELDKFRDYHASKGSVMADWQAAWRTWVHNTVKFSRPGMSRYPPQKTEHQLRRDATAQVIWGHMLTPQADGSFVDWNGGFVDDRTEASTTRCLG